MASPRPWHRICYYYSIMDTTGGRTRTRSFAALCRAIGETPAAVWARAEPERYVTEQLEQRSGSRLDVFEYAALRREVFLERQRWQFRPTPRRAEP